MQKWYEDFVDLMKSIFDFSLFLDPKFVFINLAILLLFVWYIVPYFYITEHIMRYNFSESDGAFIISLIGEDQQKNALTALESLVVAMTVKIRLPSSARATGWVGRSFCLLSRS